MPARTDSAGRSYPRNLTGHTPEPRIRADRLYPGQAAAKPAHPTGGKPDLSMTRATKTAGAYAYGHKWRTARTNGAAKTTDAAKRNRRALKVALRDARTAHDIARYA